MENASKALLIAGAILLVIAIIAIGMTIYGQAQKVVTDTGAQVDTMSVNAHNQMFEGIENNAIIKGSKLKDLYTKIQSYNGKLSTTAYTVTITVTPKAGTFTAAGDIKSNADYKISNVVYGTATSGIAGALQSFTASEQ